jgi:proteasome activator subunit 4
MQVIAEAMMAVLPGIDANDESKTAAVFQFYTAVLASIPQLRGAADDDDADAAGGGSADVLMMEGGGGQQGAAGVYRLPLYLEDWVEQVMERLLSLLSNLDTGAGHKGTDTQAKSDLLLRSSGIGKVCGVVAGRDMLSVTSVSKALPMCRDHLCLVLTWAPTQCICCFCCLHLLSALAMEPPNPYLPAC